MPPSSSSGASKRSWPLLALAVLAFVPGLGVIFGSAAVTWGLVSDRPRARLAIALGAAGALVQMLGSLGLVLWMRNTPMVREIQATTTRAELARLVAELDTYRAEAGRYPPGHPGRHPPPAGRLDTAPDRLPRAAGAERTTACRESRQHGRTDSMIGPPTVSSA
jgi:hypothetical protein